MLLFQYAYSPRTSPQPSLLPTADDFLQRLQLAYLKEKKNEKTIYLIPSDSIRFSRNYCVMLYMRMASTVSWPSQPSHNSADSVNTSSCSQLTGVTHQPSQQDFIVVEKLEKDKKEIITIPLSKEEIEADILAMTGLKPRRRPKKRTKNMQRKVDNLFPGLCLKSMTPNA